MIISNALQSRAVTVWRVLGSASARTQLYIMGGSIMVLGIGVMLLPITRPLFEPMAIVGAAFMAAAIVIECYLVTLRALETAVGKLAGTLIVAAVVPIALGMSSNIVGGATGQSPSDLPYAVGLIAPFTAGYFIVIASAIVMFGGMLIGVLMWILALILGRKEQINRDALKFLARLVGIICLFTLVNEGWRRGAPSYEGGLRWMASTAAYILDTYPSSECGAEETAKLKRISDGIVIVASKAGNEISFVRKQCLLVGQGDAPPPA